MVWYVLAFDIVLLKKLSVFDGHPRPAYVYIKDSFINFVTVEKGKLVRDVASIGANGG